ncbi:hypothetical protein ACWNYQ_00570 [Candidatus Vidania fulgoroideorum]
MKLKNKYLIIFLIKIKEIYEKNNPLISICFKDKNLFINYTSNITSIVSINKVKEIYNNEFLLDYKKIFNLSKNFKKDDLLDIFEINNKIHIKCNSFHYISIKKYNENYKHKKMYFPNDIKDSIILKKCFFLSALKYNLHNIKKFNNEETGLNIIISRKKISLFSTDGFTMSLYNYKSNNIYEIEFNISKKIVKTLINLLKYSKNDNFKVKFINKYICFVVDNFVIKSKENKKININKKIFDYSKFYKVKILLNDFKNIIKIFNCISENKNIDILIKDKYIFFESINNINDNIKNKLKVKNVKKKIKIRLNIKYIMEFLNLGVKKKYFYFYYKKKNYKIFFCFKKINYKKLIMPIQY